MNADFNKNTVAKSLNLSHVERIRYAYHIRVMHMKSEIIDKDYCMLDEIRQNKFASIK